MVTEAVSPSHPQHLFVFHGKNKDHVWHEGEKKIYDAVIESF